MILVSFLSSHHLTSLTLPYLTSSHLTSPRLASPRPPHLTSSFTIKDTRSKCPLVFFSSSSVYFRYDTQRSLCLYLPSAPPPAILPPSPFTSHLTNLPPDSTHFTFYFRFNHPMGSLLPTFQLKLNKCRPPPFLSPISLSVLFQQTSRQPPLLTSMSLLSFGRHFYRPADTLPSHLLSLSFGHNFDQPLKSLPTTLVHLTLGEILIKQLSPSPPLLPTFILDIISTTQ